jgi:hypothetical protein
MPTLDEVRESSILGRLKNIVTPSPVQKIVTIPKDISRFRCENIEFHKNRPVIIDMHESQTRTNKKAMSEYQCECGWIYKKGDFYA